MNQRAEDLMMNAPSDPMPEQLMELNLRVIPQERLAFFWGDHFTARGKVSVMKRATSPYVESAIRPHVAGYFSDMLKAVIAQPVMLQYLDQKTSVGPESVAGKKKENGLNENFARELLELHTLGVGGPYSQADVTELAELLTGLTYSQDGVFGFRGEFAQPGAETVLGQSYGGGTAALSDVHAALDDLARHPATARHLAQKMAVHFVPIDLILHSWTRCRGGIWRLADIWARWSMRCCRSLRLGRPSLQM
jgi:uncharacterized protein (DUF1800 family)